MRADSAPPDQTLATLLPVGEKRPIARRVLFLEPDFARQQVVQVIAFQSGFMGLTLGSRHAAPVALAIAPHPYHERVAEDAHGE